jgi:hypothetical protein
MNQSGYAVVWRQKTYYLSDLTKAVKDAFCEWVFRDMLANARRFMGLAEFIDYRDTLVSRPPQWTSLPDASVAVKLLETEDLRPNRELTRILFGLTADEMSDAELEELMRVKEADPGSDYTLARLRIKEASDPKATRAEPGSPAQTDSSEPSPASPATAAA